MIAEWGLGLLEWALNSLWAGLLAAPLAAAALWAAKRDTTLRHAFLMAALAAIFFYPLIHAAGWMSEADVALPELARRPAVLSPTPAAAPAEPTPTGWRIPAAVPTAAAILWATTTALLLARLGWQIQALARLKRSARPPAEALAAAEGRWRHGLPGRSGPLLVTPELEQPAAAGWLTPCILFPAGLEQRLDLESLRSIWLHEAAHLRRWDDWTELFERFAATVLFFHPAVHWLRGRLRAERETACDEWAAVRSGSRRRYASALTDLAAQAVDRTLEPLLPAIRRPSDLRRRLIRLMDSPKSPKIAHPGRALGGALVAGAAFALTVSAVSPRLVLAQEAARSQASTSLPETRSEPARDSISGVGSGVGAGANSGVAGGAAAGVGSGASTSSTQAASAPEPPSAAVEPPPAPVPAPTPAPNPAPVAAPQPRPAPQPQPAPRAEPADPLASPATPPAPATPAVPAAPRALPVPPPAPPPPPARPESRHELHLQAEEIQRLASEIRQLVEQQMAPLHAEMRELAERVRSEVEPAIRAREHELRRLAHELAESPENVERRRLLEERVEQIQERAQEAAEVATRQTEEKLREIEKRLEPMREQLQELEQQLQEKQLEDERP